MIDDSYFKALENEIKATKEAVVRAEKHERFIEAMKNYQGEDKLETSLEIAERIKAGEEIPIYSTGIGSLDALLRGGFRPGQLIIVGAQTKHGKTEFCVYLTTNMVAQHPLWFSYEDGADELVERFIDRGVTVPLFYTPATLKQRSLEWLEERIVESVVKHGTRLVFIDNLQSVIPRGQQQENEYTFFVRGLKDIADKWKVAIVLVHHLVKTELDRSPDLNDLKGSSSIAQFANTVILLWRQTGRSDNEIIITENVSVSVQAARRGKPGTVRMTFDGTTFHENNWNADIDTFNARKF